MRFRLIDTCAASSRVDPVSPRSRSYSSAADCVATPQRLLQIVRDHGQELGARLDALFRRHHRHLAAPHAVDEEGVKGPGQQKERQPQQDRRLQHVG